MQFSFPAANLQQKLHICKHSGVFSSNKMKFYGLNGHRGVYARIKTTYRHI